MRLHLLGAAVSLAVAVVYGQNATFCPATDNVCYVVNVPSSGEASAIFFQIRGPSTMSWIGLGQGTRMAGSNIFVIYANAAGNNVTLSSRQGTGERQPQSATTTDVTLLDGSGIKDGMMIANVKCINCQRWSGGMMDFASSSAFWIYAYKRGDPILSDSVSANIEFHDQYGSFIFDLAAATGGDGTTNPFTSTSASTSSGNLTTTTTNSDIGSSSQSIPVGINATVAAHGVLGAIAFLLLFPIGSVIIRLLKHRNVMWVHVVVQLLGYITALALMETGVWIAVNNGTLMAAHPILGLVVVCSLFLQPFIGLAHHMRYKRIGRRNRYTEPHLWWGRVLVSLGIINGGLGLQLAQADLGMIVAYGSVAGVSWSIWMGVAALTSWRRYFDEQKGDVKSRIAVRRGDESHAKSAELSNLDGMAYRS